MSRVPNKPQRYAALGAAGAGVAAVRAAEAIFKLGPDH
jgi:hypothetical protein